MTHDEIRRKIRDSIMTMRIADEEHKKAVRRIEGDIQSARAQCDHPADQLEYHPDPSGNNDSSYTCKICGTERRRF